MMNDSRLYEYLQQEEVESLIPIDLSFFSEHSKILPTWSVRFHQLTEEAMYQELSFVITQLTIAEIPEEQRLDLMYEVTKVGQVLISKLHMNYMNQTGLLNEEQQNALDKVLAIYYSTIMFYYSVWQRLAGQIDVVEERTTLAFFKRFGKSSITPQDIVKRCVFSMMVLLKQALLEKQIGYRQNTQVIWHYLNACYNFARGYGWQGYSFDLNTLLNYQGKQSIDQIYRQCVLSDILRPYSYRRHDLLSLHSGLIAWERYLEITDEPVTKPFVYINLQGNEGAKLLMVNSKYNPFSVDSTAIFINLQPLLSQVDQLISQPVTDSNKGQIRLAQLARPNIEKMLLPETPYIEMNEPCQIVMGFHQIHFILAGKTSLDNLIHSHQLPERLRPSIQTNKGFDKPSPATLTGNYAQYRKLYFQYLYQNTDETTHISRTPMASPINQFQINAMMAVYTEGEQGTKNWQMGKLLTLKQQALRTTDTSQNTGVELQVELLGKGIVPCGVRLQNPESRQPRFMPALIIPKSETLNRETTSLMMARFGYQTGDKIIIRIDNKEVQARLTQLLNLTDDVEEYNFVRVV